MSDAEAGRLVTAHDDLVEIYSETVRIAVVGASDNRDKHAGAIPAYLQGQGYRVLPVNPRGGEILGVPAYRSLGDVDVAIDVVEVFRPPAEAEGVARAAVDAGAKVLWFQPGTHTDAAARIATDAGLRVVIDRCMGVTHGDLGLGPGPRRLDDS